MTNKEKAFNLLEQIRMYLSDEEIVDEALRYMSSDDALCFVNDVIRNHDLDIKLKRE